MIQGWLSVWVDEWVGCGAVRCGAVGGGLVFFRFCLCAFLGVNGFFRNFLLREWHKGEKLALWPNITSSIRSGDDLLEKVTEK